MFGAIAGGIASALAAGAMSKLFGGGQKAASGGIQGDVLATDNSMVVMCHAGVSSAQLFGGWLQAASGGIQGDVVASDNNTVGMGDAGIKSAIRGSNVPNRDEAVTSFVSVAMAKAGKGLLEGTLQAGTSA